jgi:hypothetical protein
MYPHGIDQHVTEAGKKSPTEDLLAGKLLLINQKDPIQSIVSVLAALANHADMADSLPACQALDWIRSNAWHDPSDMPFPDLIRTTDVLCLFNLMGLQKDEVFLLDREIAVRAYGSPKITILLGGVKAPFKNVVDAYEGRVGKLTDAR